MEKKIKTKLTESKIFKKILKKFKDWRADEVLILINELVLTNWNPNISRTKKKLISLDSFVGRIVTLNKEKDYQIGDIFKYLKDNRLNIEKKILPLDLARVSDALEELSKISYEIHNFSLYSSEAKEGSSKKAFHFYRERNKKIINLKKQLFIQQHGGLYCEACGFDFFSKYGERGKNYAEVHHNIPISDPAFTGKTRLSDLSVLCSNCHRMIHRKNPWISVAELKNIIYQQKVA